MRTTVVDKLEAKDPSRSTHHRVKVGAPLESFPSLLKFFKVGGPRCPVSIATG